MRGKHRCFLWRTENFCWKQMGSLWHITKLRRSLRNPLTNTPGEE